MGDLDRDVQFHVGLDVSDTDRARDQYVANTQRMAAAGRSAASQTSTAWATVDPGISRVNQQLVQLGVRYQETGAISVRSLTAIGVTLKQVEAQYGKNAAAAVGLSEAERRSFAASQDAYKQALNRLREYNSVQQEVGRQTRDWTSLQGAIEGLGGPLGNIVKIGGGVAAALTAGWQAGRKLDEEILSKLPNWKKSWEDLASSVWGYEKAIRSTADLIANDPRFAGTRTQQLGPQIIARQAQGGRQFSLDSVISAAGIKTIDDANKAISDLNKNLLNLERQGKGATDVFLQGQRGTIQEIVDQYASAGKTIPAEIAKIAAGLDIVSFKTKEWQQTVVGAAQKALTDLTSTIRQQLGAGASYSEVVQANSKALLDASASADLLNLSLTEQQKRWIGSAQAAQAFLAAVKNNGFAEFQKAMGTNVAFTIFGSDEDAQKRIDQLQRFETEEEERRRQLQDDLNRKIRDGLIQASEDASQIYVQNLKQLSSDMADLFVSGIQDGATGFAQTASSIFTRNLKKSAEDIFSRLGDAVFGGGQVIPVGATPEQAAQITQSNQRAANATQGAINLLALFSQLGSATSGVNNPRQNPIGNVIGTTVTGLSAGASIGAATALGGTYGGIIGAIVGLIVGGLMLALAPAVGKDYPYAKFGVQGGRGFFDPTQNITDNERLDALARLKQTYSKFWTGYVRILAELPLGPGGLTEIMKTIGTDVYPTVGLDQPSGDIGHAASKNFWQNFANYLSQGMPRDIAAKFFEPLSAGFQKLGLTAEAFKAIWDQLQGIDPGAAMEALMNIAVGLKEIQKATDYFGKSGRGLLGIGFADANKTFVASLKEGDAELVKFAETIQFLPFEDQAAAIKKLGDAEAERMDRIKGFLAGIAQAIDQVQASYQGLIRGLQLEGIKGPDGKPDVQGQVDFLKQYADQLLSQIRGATSPQEVLQLSQELQNTIMQIKALGGSVSPEANEAFRKWAITNLQIAQDAVTDRLKAFADQVAEQNKAFTDAIQGFIDAFLTATAQLTGDGTGTGGGTGNQPTVPQFITDANGNLIPNPAWHPPTGNNNQRNPYIPGSPGGAGIPYDEDNPRGGRGQGYRGTQHGPGTSGDSGGLWRDFGDGTPGSALWRPGMHWPWQSGPFPRYRDPTQPNPNPTPYDPFAHDTATLSYRRGDAAAALAPALQRMFEQGNRDQVRLLSDVKQLLEENNRIARDGQERGVVGVLEVVDQTGQTVERVPLQDDGFGRRTYNGRRG